MSEEPLLPNFEPWDAANTRRFLDKNPLPLDFTWVDQDGDERPVRPRHTSVTSYGKWLQETPYFPGLFEIVHRVLVNAPLLGGAEWLVEELNQRRPPKQEKLSL
jgi:hypothetical protein